MITTREQGKAKTREGLIDAGLRLAERTGLSGLSINLLVEEAGVSKGGFFHHFKDRASYLLALHRGFHERLLAELLEATDGMEPGRERLILGGRTYLNACLRDRGVRALLLEARAVPVIAEEVMARNTSTAKLVKPDFEQMGWKHPLDTARLWVALVAEVALVELESGKRKPSARAALEQFLDGGPAAAS